MVAAALVVSALSLLAPWAIAFDAWSWIIWGREVTRLVLDTAGGPSWKPLSVVFTTVFAFFGSVAPELWLVAARAGGLLALGGVAALAHRLAGPVAAAIAPALMLVSDWWLFHTYLGQLRGDARRRVGLGDRRPPRRAPSGRARARRRRGADPARGVAVRRPLRAVGVAPRRDVVLGRGRLAVAAPDPVVRARPDRLGRRAGRLGRRARLRAPASAANAAVPVLEVWRDAGGLLTVPVLLAVALGVWLGGRTERVLFGMACAWVLIVGVLSQAGYPGNPRYNVPPP